MGASHGFGILALALAASPRPQEGPGKEVLLARVPPDLEIAAYRVPRLTRSGHRVRSSIAWSEDGPRVAYAARRGEVDWLPVVGAKVGEVFVYVSPPVLAGGRAFFHVARHVRPHEQHSWLWVDGKRLGPEDWMSDIAVRADGRQVAYWTQPGAKVGAGSEPVMDPKNHFVLATKKGSSWSFARGGKWFEGDSRAPLYSGDGKHVFTSAIERGKGWRVLEAGTGEVPRCDPCPVIVSFAVSADGSALAYVRMNPYRADSAAFMSAEDGAELHFKGKRVGRNHAIVSMPAVDPRGAHVAYVVTKDGRRSVAIDDETAPGPGYDFVFDLAFDPTGERLAFVANKGGKETPAQPGLVAGGEWFAVVRSVDGTTKPVEHPAFLEVRDLTWDTSGERLAYGARDASGWRVVCGEARSAAHTDVGAPFFAADGRSIGFGSRDDRELWWRVLALP